MRPLVSVIICAHNPVQEHLSRVLNALQAQTFQTDQWEILLVDNASTPPVVLSSGQTASISIRTVREPALGLTSARVCGIRESQGDLLVFVDDDNILDKDYVANASKIAASYPFLGAFGGSITGEFEEPPPQWALRHLTGLAICEITRDYWSNLTTWSLAVPYGAGMCVRRTVAEEFARRVAGNPLRKLLGRAGKNFASSEDLDLAFCAVDLGMGTGRFHTLRLTHLIGKERLTLDYLTRLNAGIAGSNVVLNFLRTGSKPDNVPWRRQLLRLILEIAGTPWRERGIPMAVRRAERQARHLIANHIQYGNATAAQQGAFADGPAKMPMRAKS